MLLNYLVPLLVMNVNVETILVLSRLLTLHFCFSLAVVEAAPEVADDWDADSDWEANLDAITINLEVSHFDYVYVLTFDCFFQNSKLL